MREEEPIEQVLGALEALRITSMLTGSFASNYYGEPRSTHDADFVIQATAAHLKFLLKELGKEFVSGVPEEELLAGQQFNVIHLPTSFKIDFWPLRSEPFDQSAFARRKRVRLFGREVFIPTAEDLILQKLRWGRNSGSEVQRRDVVGILRGQEGNLDWEYLNRWAGDLGVRELLEQLRRQAMGPSNMR